MALESDLTGIGGDIEAYRGTPERKSLLRFMICGGGEEARRALIGRLLGDSDDLEARREQGTTVNVSYRSFSTDRREFIVADTPGREQDTCDVVTAASSVDLAVILIDADKGVLTQTRWHSYLILLLGIRKLVLAVNKMDQFGLARETFDLVFRDYRELAKQTGLDDLVAIPMYPLKGHNVTEASPNTPWYRGPTLLEYLELVETGPGPRSRSFRMPVQSVNRVDRNFQGFAGMILSGAIRKGDRIRVTPSGIESRVARIVTEEGDLECGFAGQSVTLTLEQEIAVDRGDLLAGADSPAAVADQFLITLIWMHEEPMLPGRPYLMKVGTRSAGATITLLKYKVNVNTLEHVAAKQLERNEIGICNLSVDRQIPFDSFTENRSTGGFILIDRFTNAKVGAGLIQYALRRADNIHWQALDVNKAARASLKHQKPCVLWFTGLSGAGKSTIANLLEKRLLSVGRHTYLLDGDNVRHGLNRDLGFTDADRVENIRRVAEVMRLMVDAGLIVLVSFISPFRSERRMARDLVAEGEFIEVFVDAPLAEAERRDTKGLYSKARRGELKHFTGIDSPYEAPEHPDLKIDTIATTPDEAVELIVGKLAGSGILGDHS
jgi:bifunctional enzyme CysN/CysC